MITFSQWLESLALMEPPKLQGDLRNILGWKVHFNTSNVDESEVDIKRDVSLVQHAIAALKSLGIRKNIRVPLQIDYVYGGSERGAGGAWGGSRGDNERTVRPMVNIERGTEESDESFVHNVAHEIGHIIFHTLTKDEQRQIKWFAGRMPQLTGYGDPRRTDVPSHMRRNWESGNEWFADVVALVATGKITDTNVVKDIKDMIIKHKTPHAGISYTRQ